MHRDIEQPRVIRDQQVHCRRLHAQLSQERSDLAAMVGLVIQKMKKGSPQGIRPGLASQIGICERAGESFLLQPGHVLAQAVLDAAPPVHNRCKGG